MASSESNTTDTGSGPPLVSAQRKKEVLGLVLMAMALLLSLAFLTYHPADDTIVESAHLAEALFNPQAFQAQFPIQNALGLLGAELARFLVPGFLGYSILFVSGLIGVWGYGIFRRWSLRPLLYPSLLALLSAFVMAILVGWGGHTAEINLPRWAGVVGMGVAGWMQRAFGPPGSFILLMLSVAVMLLLVIDHDIQTSVDRVVHALHALLGSVQDAWTGVRDWGRGLGAPANTGSSTAAESTPTSASSSSSDQPSPSQDAPSSESPPDPATPEQDSSQSDRSEPESDGTSATPASVTLQLPEVDDEGRPLRRNDLFRARLGPTIDASSQSPSPPPASPEAADDQDAQEDEPTTLDFDQLEEEFDEALDASEDDGAAASTTDSDDSTPSSPSAPSPDESTASEPEPSASSSPDDQSSTASASDATSDAGPSSPSGSESTSSEPSEVEDEDVELTVKERVEEEKTDEIERPAETPEEVEYESPPLELLTEAGTDDATVDREELEKNKRVLLDKLDTYNIEIENISAVVGPTVTRYELTPAPGVKVSRIESLEDDLAMALAAPSIRIMAPIPGKSAVGVEIPNRDRELVRLREVIGTTKFGETEKELPLPMGKTIEGEVFLADLTKMPHLLIAGATGSGKSVGLNGLMTGLIYACHPSNLKFVVIDPKKIELQQYTALETQFIAQPEDIDQTVVTDIEEAAGVLKSVEKEMEGRYDLLSTANVRGISDYNQRFQAGDLDPEDGHRHMPYIVVVVDELADLMMSVGDDIEGPISRLAQMARAVGIHLVLATQRPSVDVITGIIKANFPSRIAYEVASRVDSRTILDQGGAEGLVGNGDMLFLSGSDLIRLQGPFVSVDEVEDVVNYVANQPEVQPYTLPSLQDAGHGPDVTLGVEDTDENFEEAARVIVRRQQGSVSLLQRKLAVGYTRAARIVDQLEEAGIVGPYNGTKARKVLVDDEEELDRLLSEEAE